MLKPEPMQRTLIVSSRGYQTDVIEALHAAGAAHLVEFQEHSEGELEGFRIGEPLPEGDAASGRLVRIRALIRQLGLEGAEAEPVLARDFDARLDTTLDTIEAAVHRAVETRETIRTQLATGEETEAKLEPLRTIPIRLEDYRGYDTLTTFVGRADPAFEAELGRVAPDHLLARGEGQLFALFVPSDKATETGELLYRHGYAELEVPEGQGSPEERIREIANERASLRQRLEKAEQDVTRLAQEHRDWLLAADEHLSIVVEKAEAPLNFASTENAFVVDAWVPATQVDAVQAKLDKATAGNVHFALLETSNEHDHDHHEHHDGGADAAYAAHLDQAAPRSEPPTKYHNANAIQPFQWFTNLFSLPRYNEIDPTAVFAVFFPLFFGFMIGDLGLGILMVLLGALLIKKLPRVDGMKQLGTAFVVAGLIAAAFGGLVFKDALGIPLGVTHHMEDELHAEGLASPTCMDLYVHLEEPTWTCLFRGSDSALHFESWAEPLVAKVSDVSTMLLLSVIAAFVHLLIGLLFGIRNEMGHGTKHLMAKVGYLVLLLTFLPAVVALLRPDMFAGFAGEVTGHPAITAHLPITQTTAYLTAGVGFLVGAVILGWAEGFGGVLEIPSMFSAIMSYLRLGAVAIAKGAMAVAFNAMTLVAALKGGGLIIILGIVGFLVAQVVLFVLGILSSGIQALRLNFVEFFTKFYKGGGTPYRPFGRERRLSASASAAAGTSAVANVLITGHNRP